MIHVFLTNDDGVEAPGIRAMALALSSLARVTVVAPHHGRSSCSSSLTLHQYLRVWPKNSMGENISVFACNGTTADCCKISLEYLLREDKPDLIVSGINNGYNTGSDCLYSGTVAGAMEGTFFGIPSIAVSAETARKPGFLAQAADFACQVIRRYFLAHQFRGILNLNLPEGADLSWEKLHVTKLGLQRYDNAIRALTDPSGHIGYWLAGTPAGGYAPDEDVYWIHRGEATLTPIQWDQTDNARLVEVQHIARGNID